MFYFLVAFGGFYVLSQGSALGLLAWARRRSKLRAQAHLPLKAYPGISIITSLKGPTPGAAESVLSLLRQNYPGSLEIIFATLDDREPLIAEIKDVIAHAVDLPGNREVRWIHPVRTAGLNPRTAKIAQAYAASQYPWVFMICVDTRFAPDYLRKAMELTELKVERYVTSFPVIDSPRNFSAKLEAVGLNVDVSQFFLLSSLSPKAACAYGGAFLFSRSLAEKAGAYLPLLPLLTDDITLAQALARQGGLCYLTDELAYVRQTNHTFQNYWIRQIRWRMIGRYFLPDLYWLAPLSWAPLFLVVGAVGLGDARLGWMAGAVLTFRVLIAIGIQRLLETPAGDWRHAWVLPVYDALAVPTWILSILKNSVTWGSTRMILNRRGSIIRSVDIGR